MDAEQFERVFENVIEKSRETLLNKAKEYASDYDRLHNFKIAGPMVAGTPEQALWGFLVKHLISIRDMVNSSDAYEDVIWDEKIGDAINYLILLKALIVETKSKGVQGG